ncbi:MAG TPA: glycosyltransferase [Myxococcota bacterium]|nr:glycosyltransferase [Myxococcota bacterium]
MHRFWNSIIKPLIDIVQPKTILEIGSDKGDNTRNILAFCLENDAVLHAIDPEPKFDAGDWQREFGKHLVFYHEPSLDALSRVVGCDMVFIDGDHNWYTVFNELKLIWQSVNQDPSLFPVVLLHDVGWPYGRRDLYYNPDVIPSDFRQPFKKKGMLPGDPCLQENGGLNSHLHNAEYENQPRSGVLTAIEDFLKEVGEKEFKFIKLVGLHGLGILASEHLTNRNPDLDRWLTNLVPSEQMQQLLEAIEQERIRNYISAEEWNYRAKRDEEKIAVLKKQIEKLALAHEKEETESRNLLGEKEAAIKKITQDLEQRATELENLGNRFIESEHALAASRQSLAEAESALSERADELESLARQLNLGKNEIKKLKLEISSQKSSIGGLEGELSRREARLAEEMSRGRELSNEINRRARQLSQAVDLIKHLEGAIRAVLRSKRWKTGNLVADLFHKLPGVSQVPDIRQYIDNILDSNEHWLKSVDTLLRPGATPATPSPPRAAMKKTFPETYRRLEKLLEGKRRRPARLAEKTNIVLYSSGSCEPLRRSLVGLKANTDLESSPLMLIDDSQDESVAEKVDQWCADIPSVHIERPHKHLGYFRALQEIMGGIEGDLCLLRETAVVTPGWLEGLQGAAFTADNIGIVSPITNSNPAYEFRMNPGDNIVSCSKKIRLLGSDTFPGTFPHFDIIYLRRQAFDYLRGADNPYSSGYLPFLELAARLLQDGLLPILADDTYVYTSVKYSRLTTSHVKECLAMLPTKQREWVESLIDYSTNTSPASLVDYARSDLRLVEQLSLGVLFHSISVRGGVYILTEMMNDLILKGIDAKAILLNPRQFESQYFDLLFEPLYSTDPQTIAAALPDRAALMATFWPTASLAREIADIKPSLKTYYLIQDFEPNFYNPSDPNEKVYFEGASNSYHLGLDHLATSKFIIEKVREHLGERKCHIRKIGLGANLEIYRGKHIEHAGGFVRIVAMARPETPRRGFDVLVKTLSAAHNLVDNIEICLFGSTALDAQSIPFPFVDLGVIDPERLREEYRKSDIFLETSHFQGFGLAALEAMACGCACVITESGGVSEYAVDNANVLMAKPGDWQKLADLVVDLVRDASLRKRLVENGYATVGNFSNHNVASSIAPILQSDLLQTKEASSWCDGDEAFNIVIPVYNQLHVVRPCLESVAAYTSEPYKVYVVDDASDQATAEFLKHFCSIHGQFKYLRNEENLGFVASANRGMAEPYSGHIVLLNSDTLVTPGWLGKLRLCMKSDDRIGIISPLGTTSSHLWLKMNPGDSILDAAQAIERLSERKYPDVVTPEGWCFVIRRSVYDHQGGFDQIFGRGYCEESDYSMRAYARGYRLVCCDDAFVYHEGRATFGKERGPRYLANRAIFDSRWKPLYDRIYRKFLADNPLDPLRRRYAAERKETLSIEEASKLHHPEVITILDDAGLPNEMERFRSRLSRLKRNETTSPRVVFLLSTLEQNGGVLSVAQLANDMIRAGVDTKVVLINPKGFDRDMALLTEPIFYENRESLLANFPPADIVVGTLWITMYYMVKLFSAGREFLPAYFVQDYEVDFYPPSDEGIRNTIRNTYRLTPFCFAKTEWICSKVRTAGGKIELVPPALDLDVFYPRPMEPVAQKVILGMLRPKTPQRGFQTIVKVLSRLSETRSDFVFHSFGSSNEEISSHDLPFPLVNHGIVNNKQLPNFYSSAYLFIDFSSFHGFGRTIAEAMACGVPAVVTDSGGVRSFAQDDVNCLMSPADDEDSMFHNLNRLLDDERLRERLATATRESVMKFERRKSAEATTRFLKNCLRQPSGTESLGEFPGTSKLSSHQDLPIKGDKTEDSSLITSKASIHSEFRTKNLLLKAWAAHRFTHVLAAFEASHRQSPIRSVLSVGCGHGYPEMHLALIYPSINFVLTDYDPNNFENAQNVAARHKIKNVQFRQMDILEEVTEKYDLVMTVEVLEHIQDHAAAATHLQQASNCWLYNLVPFASSQEQQNIRLCQRELERHQHVRPGYDRQTLLGLFPGMSPLYIRNCYYSDALALRQRVEAMTPEELRRAEDEIYAKTLADLRDSPASSRMHAQGIEMLARVT